MRFADGQERRLLPLRQLRRHQRVLLEERFTSRNAARGRTKRSGGDVSMEELQERVTRMLETLTFEQLEMVIKYAESLNRNAGSAFDNELVVLLEDEISAA